MKEEQTQINSGGVSHSPTWNQWFLEQKGIWLAVVVLILAPGILLASPFMAAIVLLIGVIGQSLIVGFSAIFSKAPQLPKVRGILIMLVACVGAIFYCSQIDKLIPVNAMPLATAIEAFHKDNGHYPETLEAVIPKYLPEVPTIKPTIIQPSIRYMTLDGKPILTVASVAGDAFAAYQYDFESKTWVHHS